MKRGLFLVLIIILFLPLVSATISITGPAKTQYNIGEEIDLSGYIQETEDLSGELQFSLVCNGKTNKFQEVDIDINAGEEISFSQLTLPTVTATSSMQGLCKIKGDILVNSAVTETASSSSFEISEDLEGSFSLDQAQIQLGDTITVTGTITDLDGDALEGSAEIYFESQGEEYFMDFVNIESGVLSYSNSFTNGGAASYKINLIVRDSYGNEQEFNNVESFTVLDDLQVTIDTNVQTLSPGDTLNVFGDVKTVLQDYVSTATVDISLDDDTQSTSLADSKFTQDISIPSTITSGQHTITVEVEDIYGNAGSSSLKIEVEAQATKIENKISNGTLNPEDQVSIGVTLYDQADDVMTDYVTLEVYDSKSRLITQTDIASEESITYKIPQFAPPGEWTVKSYYLDTETQQEQISASDSIFINELQKLDFQIVDTLLYITNVGNVKYTDDVDIEVTGLDQDYLIKKTKNLGVNETIVIDLSEELPSGTYTISIPTGYNTAEQSEISIVDGKTKATLTWPYTILALLFIIGLSYLIYARVRPRKEKEHPPGERPAQKTKQTKIRLYDPKREAEKGKKVSVTFEDKQQSMDDFKQRTLEEIKRTEEKIAKDSRRVNSLSEGKLGYVTGRNDAPVKLKPVEKPSTFSLFDD